ncbi:MAG: hypothetical protein Q7R41_14585 [Phycisphaerales bacterium]|nr:hypothetical protein [Phycisphaerales bacterium]
MAKTDEQVRTALLARRDAVLDALAGLTATAAGGGVNSQLGGVDHHAKLKLYYEELALLDRQLASYEDPFEVAVEGVT